MFYNKLLYYILAVFKILAKNSECVLNNDNISFRGS